MTISVRDWSANHDSVSVNYGPLTFSLDISEHWKKLDSSKTAIGDSHWQKNADPSKWPSFEIDPASSWNYGLVLNTKQPEKSFRVRHRRWPANNFPFTEESCPIELVAKAKLIPEWTMDRNGLCATLQQSPIASDQPTQTVKLVPMGAARLRISAFPVIGSGADAHQWVAQK